jgi:hypothetical protein
LDPFLSIGYRSFRKGHFWHLYYSTKAKCLKNIFGIFFVLIELRSKLEPKVELMPEGVPVGGFDDDSMMEEEVTNDNARGRSLAAASKEFFFIEIR